MCVNVAHMKGITTEDFINRSKGIHGETYDYSEVKYVNNSANVSITCPVHGTFEQRPFVHWRGAGCAKCSTEKTHADQTKSTEVFINECIKKFGKTRFDYSLVEYKGAFEKIKIICLKHGEFEVVARSHFRNNGCCMECRRERLYGKFSDNCSGFIKKAQKIHVDLYDYSEVEYYNQATKVKIKCNIHDYLFSMTPNNHLRGKGCPKCRSSKGEALIRKFLIKNQISFEEQKQYDECKYKQNLSFDFYLNDHNVLIEFQGEQHYVHCNMFHSVGSRSLMDQQIKDQIKWEFAKQNDIRLIEIPYWSKETIPEILEKELET